MSNPLIHIHCLTPQIRVASIEFKPKDNQAFTSQSVCSMDVRVHQSALWSICKSNICKTPSPVGFKLTRLNTGDECTTYLMEGVLSQLPIWGYSIENPPKSEELAALPFGTIR